MPVIGTATRAQGMKPGRKGTLICTRPKLIRSRLSITVQATTPNVRLSPSSLRAPNASRRSNMSLLSPPAGGSIRLETQANRRSPLLRRGDGAEPDLLLDVEAGPESGIVE